MFSEVTDSVAGIGCAVAAGVARIIAVIFAFIPTILSFDAGIIGVKYCDNLAKAQTCFVWGIILVVLQVTSLLLAFSASNLIGLVLPIIYLVGAVQNKKCGGVGSSVKKLLTKRVIIVIITLAFSGIV